VLRGLRDIRFSRFDTMPECDRQTGSYTHDDDITYRVSIASCGKMYKFYLLSGNTMNKSVQ